jgi:hypothetical protein
MQLMMEQMVLFQKNRFGRSSEKMADSMPTNFAIILLLIAGGTAVASFKRHRNDRDDYDEPDDDTEEEI